MSSKTKPSVSKAESLKLTLPHTNMAIQKTTTARVNLTNTQNKMAKSPVVLFGSSNRSPLPIGATSSSSPRGLAKLLESARPIHLSSPKPTVQSPKQSSVLQFVDARSNVSKVLTSPRTKVPSGKGGLEHIPTISLGSKRVEPQQATTSKRTSTDSEKQKFKTYYTDGFWKNNKATFKEFAMRKKRRNTSHGVFEEAFNIEIGDDNAKAFRGRNAQPFSREVMTSLEASLEVNYKYGYFLKEVSSRVTRNIYPPPDVIYVIMKAILLEAEEKSLANSASALLLRILELHPSQASDIKSETLYHKAFALMTVPDIDETSVIILTIGDWLSRSDKEDWSNWCSRDANLGTLWTFYSRVFKIAINNPTTAPKNDGVKVEPVSPQKIHNATLLTNFLTKLAWKDYQDVLSRNEYSSNSPMVKCLIADLLWPTMTGLEPWYRRPSPNLADMIALYVKAVQAHVAHLNAAESEEGASVQSDDSGEDDDQVEDSLLVVEQLSHLIAITSSWCVLCDVRDKERGRRTATKSLEAELVQTLRFELEEKSFDVLEIALEHLPTRLRLKVNTSLVQEICSDALVPDSAKPDEGIFLQLLTSRHMQLMPIVLPGEENESAYSEPNISEASRNENETENRGLTKTGKSTTGVNKRNRKGETPLHIACMNNRPESVENLLKQPGINPNLTDYAGWTALGEACNHGHLECVRCLLQLPVKKDKTATDDGVEDSSSKPAIDLSLCPSEGLTPLHDALGNGHLDIACLLLEKGGVQLLNNTDSSSRTPLDYCEDEAARAYMIERACNMAVKDREKKHEVLKKKDEYQAMMKLAPIENYMKVLPRTSVLESESWRARVCWIFKLTCLLLSHYVTSGEHLNACMEVLNTTSNKSHVTESIGDDVVITDEGLDTTAGRPARQSNTKKTARDVVDTERFANDVIFCMRWKDCWDVYLEHIKRLLGGDEEAMNDVISETESPIPMGLLAA